MGSEWTATSVGALLEKEGGHIQTGPFGTKLKASEYTEEGVPVISVGEVRFGRLELHDRTPNVPPAVTERIPEYLLRSGDIVFGRKGAVERSGLVMPEQDGWFLGSDGIRIRLPSCCDPRFVSYHFLTEMHKRWMVQNAAGTTMASLNETIVKMIPLNLPPLKVQKAIAHILGKLDDKIELNRGMNETLESMARALFKSWFVDFDPVIDKALADTQPTVQDLIDGGTLRMGDGYRAKRIELAEVGLPFVRAGNLQHGGFDFSDAELLCEESCVDAGEKNSQPFDVAFTSKGTVGRMTMVMPQTQPFVYSPQVCWWRVIDQSTLNPHVLYRWMESSQFMHQVAKVKGNTDMADYVSLRDQRAMHVSLPPIEEQAALAKELSSIDHKMAGNREQSQTLTKLRDTLLPQLLSGSLRIPDAEQLVAESVQ